MQGYMYTVREPIDLAPAMGKPGVRFGGEKGLAILHEHCVGTERLAYSTAPLFLEDWAAPPPWLLSGLQMELGGLLHSMILGIRA